MEEKNLEKVESKPAFRHSIPVQMRFNDIDVLGHVNNSVFFTYYDLGKSAYFTTIRKGQMNWTRPDVVIANVNCNFYAPMRFKVHQRIVNTVTKEVKSECATVMVAFDVDTQESKCLPAAWVKAICEYEGRNLIESKD